MTVIVDHNLSLTEVTKHSEELGYTLVAVNTHLDDLHDLEIQNGFSRITLVEDQKNFQEELKKFLGTKRHHYEYIAVIPSSSAVAAFAARDNRVDAIRITPKSSLTVFNKKYSRRLVENGKIVEIDVSLFWRDKIAKELRPVKRIVDVIKTPQLPFLLTNNPLKTHHLRTYQGLQAIGRVIGLSNRQTQAQVLLDRIHRNRGKIAGSIPLENVELVEW